MGPLLDYTHAYHELNIILALLATVSLLGMGLAAAYSAKWLTFAASMLFGFSATALNCTVLLRCNYCYYGFSATVYM
jgi:hypothetical protein